MNVILIGRHEATELPGIKIIEQRSITWPARTEECARLLFALLDDIAARADIGAVLFQNAPGQLTVALHRELNRLAALGSLMTGVPDAREIRVGIIVSKPGKREVRISERFAFTEQEDASQAAEAVRLANPNAKLEWVNPTHFSLSVDPPMKYEFDHIEWF